MIAGIGLFCLIVLWLLGDAESPGALVVKPTPTVRVTTIEVTGTAQSVAVEASGITMSRWPTVVSATVSGRVTALAENMSPGRLYNAGSLLVRLQNTRYGADVESARARVADARLRLAHVKNEQIVAREVGTAKSAFGRFELHVTAAEAELQASMAALSAAKQELADTRITAPFPAVIIDEGVSPGKWINAGEPLFTIASSESLQVKVELSASKWRRLGQFREKLTIEIVDPDGNSRPAQVRYHSPVLDAVTRQRVVMLEVKHPYEGPSPLLPNQQVKVRFEAPPAEHVIKAPASVLTEDGNVWVVTGNQLHLEHIEILTEQPDAMWFRFVVEPEKTRKLVRYPLSSMLSGQVVNVSDDSGPESTS